MFNSFQISCVFNAKNLKKMMTLSGDVLLKYKGSHSYLYNVKTGTIPIVIHGNGPIKVGICL